MTLLKDHNVKKQKKSPKKNNNHFITNGFKFSNKLKLNHESF